MTNEANSDTQETGSKSLNRVVRLLAANIVLCFFFISVPSGAQTVNSPFRIAAKTNLLYDLVMAPNVGLEATVGSKFTVSASASYDWEGPWFDYVRIVTADVELRYWLAQGGNAQWRGLHVGPYAAIYRYDILFGGKGQQAKANWGAGVSCGYTLPLSPHISLDFGLYLGYIGGKYKEYEVSDDSYKHNVWMADKIRHYVGPTKAEISLLWHIGGTGPKKAKGGDR